MRSLNFFFKVTYYVGTVSFYSSLGISFFSTFLFTAVIKIPFSEHYALLSAGNEASVVMLDYDSSRFGLVSFGSHNVR